MCTVALITAHPTVVNFQSLFCTDYSHLTKVHYIWEIIVTQSWGKCQQTHTRRNAERYSMADGWQ